MLNFMLAIRVSSTLDSMFEEFTNPIIDNGT